MKRTLVVAGATGSVGRALIELARADGWHTRAIGRDGRRLARCGADETRQVSFKDPAAPAVGKQRLCDYYAQRKPGVLGGMHRAEW
jgi:NADPH:quinone reductase-like Zn-dependent oxidoreductase